VINQYTILNNFTASIQNTTTTHRACSR